MPPPLAITAFWPPSCTEHTSNLPNATLTTFSYNMEHLTAIVHAAEAKCSPLIIQLFPSTLKQVPLLAHAAAHAVKTASVPLSLHIDHAQDVEHIREIIATLPVDSVMVDMSHYDEAENLAKTKALTKECHERGIAVEAESGRINGGEDGIAHTGDLKGMFDTLDTKERMYANVS
jgi:fructose-bisphosphate aldolase class II